MKKLSGIIAIAFLSGCVAVPRHYSYYDEECDAYVEHMNLEFEEIPLWVHCHDEECVGALFFTGMVGIVSTIASGAIVLAGNSYYKAEETLNCATGDPVNEKAPADESEGYESDEDTFQEETI